MKLVGLKKVHSERFLYFYIAEYMNKEGNIQKYELISRRSDLSLDSFGDTTPQAAAIVAFSMDNEKILMQREYRLGCNNWVYNFPAGLIDPGEDYMEAAKRELWEETGLELVDVIDTLPPSYSNAAVMDETLVLVIGHAKGEFKESTNINEEIEANWYTKEDIKKLIKDNALMSMRTIMFLWPWANN